MLAAQGMGKLLEAKLLYVLCTPEACSHTLPADSRPLTFWALEACRPRRNDLADAMGLPLDQAICHVDHDCCSGHTVDQLDVLKGRLAGLACAPAAEAHTLSAATTQCCSADGLDLLLQLCVMSLAQHAGMQVELDGQLV